MTTLRLVMEAVDDARRERTTEQRIADIVEVRRR